MPITLPAKLEQEVIGINQGLLLSGKEQRPILMPIEIYQDSRGWSFMNILQDLKDFGQFNFSHINGGTVKAWHRHKHQHDLWIVTRGDLKVAVAREQKETVPFEPIGEEVIIWSAVIGEHNPNLLIIPPGLWHGCSAISGPADLLYCVTKIYNRESPDEERQRHGAYVFDWGIEHG
jgi:dTDP-4-dehydrorhamnose 3,5-epimerase-like enzyme